MKWYEDDRGNISSLRLIVVPAAAIGAIAVLCGLAGMFLRIPGHEAALMTGAGMIATAQGAKAWQKRSENIHEPWMEDNGNDS